MIHYVFYNYIVGEQNEAHVVENEAHVVENDMSSSDGRGKKRRRSKMDSSGKLLALY